VRKIISVTVVFSFLAAVSPVRAAVPPAALALQNAVAELAAKAKPAVVNISVVQEQRVRVEAPDFFFGDPEDMMRQFMQGPQPHEYRFRAEGTGSGFIIDPKGYILTNEHVIREATEIRVTLTDPNGKDKTYPGKVIGRDSNFDMAVVKIETNEALPHLRLSSSKPRVGDLAIAIGSPFALEQTVTLGIVSAERQTLQIEGRLYTHMIQTDAAINRGNSGGPLLNIEGDVIGINTAIFSPNGGSTGIGFAIPADEAQRALSYLLAGKRMSRGWIGVELAPMDEIMKRRFALPSAEGALVNKVLPAGPAAKAGIQRGDVIRSFNGQPVNTPQDLLYATANLPAGAKIALNVYRHGTPTEIVLTLGERPDFEKEAGGKEEQNQNGGEGEEEHNVFQWQGVAFSQEKEGVTAEEIQRDSPLAGTLMPGDVIRGVNTREVASLNELKDATKGIKISDGIFLDIIRDGQPMYLSVKP
jgi:serine protease Do